MARIKYVLNERRLAYEQAVERFSQDKALGKLGATAEREALPAKKHKPATKVSGMNGKETIRRRRTQARAISITKEIPSIPGLSQDAALPIAPSAPQLYIPFNWN